ncbi:putative Phage major capsid protein, HK97 family [Candidatus Desulfosporosinus infrequens]|uniref:Putative Phage major capsid protein, HK97 family n=1 Tax=Candidatus Desulfosporosinus infrequens TaxID=2043169 RepID=A0A2U3LGQ1_9FIRM|nr:putative Phage major capsid protein, HK97 family [Candidatus Desulfosporosinus infrequens]
MLKRLKEIEARMDEIGAVIDQGAEMDVAVVSKEVEDLREEKRGILAKIELRNKVQNKQVPVIPVVESRAAGGLTTAEAKMYETRATKEYRNAFFSMLKYGAQDLNDEERSLLNAGNAIGNNRNIKELRFTSGSSSAGGAIPQITLDLVVQKMLIVSAVYPFVSKTNVKGNLKIAVENIFGDAAWTGEGTMVMAPGAQGTDTLGYLSLMAWDLIKMVQVSRVVEQLSIDAFEAYIVDKLFKKLMIAVENALLNGLGQSSSQPMGILNAVSWISSGGAGSGQNQYVYGKSGQGIAGLSYDTFTGTKALLKAPYHPGAFWVMSSNTLYSGVCAIKDAVGRPIFLENPQWGLSTALGEQVDYQKTAIVGRLLGNPVIMSPYIADGVILFGDLSFYHFNMSADVLIEKSYEWGFGSNDVYYKGWLLGDGGVSQTEAFVEATPHA